MELSAARYADWEACIRGVPVSEYGDPDRQSGYLFDERNGFGMGYMPALAVDRKSRPARRTTCSSLLTHGQLPKPRAAARRNRGPGVRAADSGRQQASAQADAAGHGPKPRAQGLRMKRSARRLLAASERFDEWESCVSWVPVTQYGDSDGRFGYLFGAQGAFPDGYRPGLAIDRSDWDDPDYMFLAFVGGDRPGRTCQDEPGEAID